MMVKKFATPSKGGLIATGVKESFDTFAARNPFAVELGGAALAKAVWDDFKVAGFNVGEDIKYLSDNQGTRYFVRSKFGHVPTFPVDLFGSDVEFEVAITGWDMHLKSEHLNITHTFTPQQEGL